MQNRSHRLGDCSAFHLALIAVVCVVMGLLSGSSPTRLAGTDWPTRQIDHRVDQIEAPNHTAVPMVWLDVRFADDVPDNLVELTDPTDDDEIKECIPRSELAAFKRPTGLHELQDDRATLTPFRLLAFPTRGSPSA